jgi:capsular polysaccharide transport system permease protein
METTRKWTYGLQTWFAANGFAANTVDDIKIIRALILRNLRVQYKNNPLGIFVELLRPIAICLAHYLYFTLTKRPVPGHQYAIFTIGGFAIYFTFAAAYSGAFEGARLPGGVNQIPGVTRMHLRFAKVTWAFLLHFSFAVAVVVPLLMIGQDVSFPNIPLTIATFGMAAGLGFGYGLITNNIGILVPALIPFLKVAQWGVFITSGVYDSLVTMPYVMAMVIWYNPLIHLAEYQRHAYYSGYPVYLVSLTYPLLWVVGLTFGGLLMNRALCNRKFL